MSTEHIDSEIDAAVQAAADALAKNKAEKKRLDKEEKAAKKKLANDLAAAEALTRAIKQRHEDEAEPRQHRLAQTNRIAGINDEPTPVVESEPKPANDPKPEPTPVVLEPKIIEKKIPDPETERKLQQESERAAKLQRELNEAERARKEAENKLKDCEEAKDVTKVTPNPPEQSRKPSAVDRANPSNWGWISWVLAIIGLILGWTVFGEWLEIQSQPSLWDWVAWLFRPASAAVGFFGGGLIGHFIAEKISKSVV